MITIEQISNAIIIRNSEESTPSFCGSGYIVEHEPGTKEYFEEIKHFLWGFLDELGVYNYDHNSYRLDIAVNNNQGGNSWVNEHSND